MKKILLWVGTGLLAAACCRTEPVPGRWKNEAPGVWTTVVGRPEGYDLLSSTDTKPRREALDGRSTRDFPLDTSRFKVKVVDGKTYLTFPLTADEQIYGLGLQFKSVGRRGQIMRLHMDHYGSQDNGRTHAPVPFFVSSEGYGVLINTARYVDLWIGTGVRTDSPNPPVAQDRNTDPAWNPQPYSDNLEVLVPAEGVELVLFAGEDMLDVVSRFNLWCGGGFIPPKWGLGFWQRTPTLYSDSMVRAEVEAFAANGFPLDVVGLEPGWHSTAYPCSFEWDSTRFPDPAGFADEMQRRGVKLNLWCNPYIAPRTGLYDSLVPYAGTHTVWCGIVPDYTLREPRERFKRHIDREQLALGVGGYKVDEVDGFDCWLWPDVAEFPSGVTGEQMRSTYGNLVMATVDEAYRARNLRTYGLARAANAGAVRYPYVIYSDNYSHREFVTGVVNSGFNGVLWTPEVRASRSGEEWVRRMQTTCFSPLAQLNAWADGTKPWSFPEVYEACREVALLRMQLLPYLYSTFAQYYREGVPPFRAMNLVAGFDGQVKREKGTLDGTENPYEMATIREITDQYMMGNDLLVAPLFAGETERKVVFPPGDWYDFYTGERVGNGNEVVVRGTLERIPLFVRDGAVIPMIPAVRTTAEWVAGQPLELRVYGKAGGSFDLYDDDGTTYDFEQGKYTIRRFTASPQGRYSVEELASGGGWSYGPERWRKMGE